MITFALLLAATVFVAFSIYRILPFPKGWKIAATALFCLPLTCFLLSITGRLESFPMEMASCIYVTGNSWLIFFLYTLLLFVALRLLQLCRILPASFLNDSWAGTAAVLCTVTALLVYGNIHYNHKYREVIELSSRKIQEPVKAVLLSDLHVGYHNRRAELSRWVDIINSERPDIVLIAGDVIDRSIRALVEDGDAEEFQRIQAPVYACLGNHEYYAGVEASEGFYRDAGFHLLKDSSAEVCGIVIIGRDDFKNEERAPLSHIVGNIDRSKFSILLDHQPENLDEAMESGIDFQFSGHTHNGQIWPASLVTRLKFENSYGPFKKGNTNYYVTSGLGIWGGKFRIGTRSEYVVLNLRPE